MAKAHVEPNAGQRGERVLAAALAVLLLAVLLTSHAVGGVMARYTASGASADEARVALFAHDETIDLSNVATSLVPGSSYDVALSVSNANSSKVSEVAQRYSIEVETSGNLPITYTLLRDGATVGTFSESSATHAETFQTDNMAFAAGVSAMHNYTLRVAWDASANGSRYADISDFLQVNINVTQID